MGGITFVNTCEDYKEDKISGIRTLAHVFGIKNTLLLASIFVLVGGFIDLFLILSYRIKFNTIRIMPLMAILIVGIFFFASIISISKRIYLLSISNNVFFYSKKIAAKMPTMFLITRYPLFFISLLLIS